jgi:chitin synthase
VSWFIDFFQQIVYLVVLTAGEHKAIPMLSLILIAAVYGLQALVFILRRKWDMVGWMIFYIIAIPAFSFLLPLYSFWRMDDFSWGQTRIVMGEAGKKMIVHVRAFSLARYMNLFSALRMKANSILVRFP